MPGAQPLAGTAPALLPPATLSQAILVTFVTHAPSLPPCQILNEAASKLKSCPLLHKELKSSRVPRECVESQGQGQSLTSALSFSAMYLRKYLPRHHSS